MKLAVRIFALSLVLAGIVASASAPKNSTTISHQSATGHVNLPECGNQRDGDGGSWLCSDH